MERERGEANPMRTVAAARFDGAVDGERKSGGGGRLKAAVTVRQAYEEKRVSTGENVVLQIQR